MSTATETTLTDYFSGDWEYSDTLDCYETAFRAVSFGNSWNGFATPVVTPEVAAAFMARQAMFAATAPDDMYDTLTWTHGDYAIQVLTTEIDDDGTRDEKVIEPDNDGNFDLGQLGYTFERLDDDDRIIRKVG